MSIDTLMWILVSLFILIALGGLIYGLRSNTPTTKTHVLYIFLEAHKPGYIIIQAKKDRTDFLAILRTLHLTEIDIHHLLTRYDEDDWANMSITGYPWFIICVEYKPEKVVHEISHIADYLHPHDDEGRARVAEAIYKRFRDARIK